MSSNDPMHTRTVAQLEVHQQYLGRGQRTIEKRVSRLEESERHRSSIQSKVTEYDERLARVEDALRLVKAAAGLVMLSLAASGNVNGVGEKAVRLLLGLP